jgi:DNA-binding transcriptional MerR regulator
MARLVESLGGTYFTISETSEITGIPVSTLRRWYRTGRTRAPSQEVHYGRLKINLYTAEDLEELKLLRPSPTITSRRPR